MIRNTQSMAMAVGATVVFFLMTAGSARAGGGRVTELAKLSIEELIRMKVTSVLKSQQPLSDSAAAIHVITREDIRRSGARTIPDLLRIVPGVQVAELAHNVFAVTIRGFNDIHANKLLVMVDGRSVYNHIFSGVIWSFLDVYMEEIERIEIIRGPGSSLWGANAVNGVIHIITKKAGETQGPFVQFGAGDPNAVSAAARYGGSLGDHGAFRIYAKGEESGRDHLTLGGFEAESDLCSEMGGFRADWDVDHKDRFSLQGGLLRGREASVSDDPRRPEKDIDHRSWHLQGRWRHTFPGGSEAAWQVYAYHEKRVGDYRFDILDVDFQHDRRWADRHHLVWGLGYRWITDEMIQGLFGNYTFDPMERELHLFSLFAQDTIQLLPDRLRLTLGSKWEHNSYTDDEIQPTIRISWTPGDRHTFWAAVSRAVRTPSRVDVDAVTRAPMGPSSEPPLTIRGNEDFQAEDLLAYEFGYRTDPLENLFLDFAAFRHVYDDLTAYERIEPGLWGINNRLEGETHGIEIAVDYRPFRWWRLCAAWSLLEMDLRLQNGGDTALAGYVEETDPGYQLSLHSMLDLGRHWELDAWLRHVDGVRHMRPSFAVFAPEGNTDGYTQVDLRLAWMPSKRTRISLTGRNLGGAHQEFTRYEVEKSLYFAVEIELDSR